ncbi:hypothetical protein Droror1_Dr00009473 [Drosera rotundifolia]
MTTTEDSMPLSIESFSYSWLVNLKPSFDSLSESFRAVLDASNEAFFIEMDPRMPPSKRFLRYHNDLNLELDLDLDLPCSPGSPTAVLNSDELFSGSFPERLSDPEASDSTPTKRSLTGKSSNLKARKLSSSKSLSKQILVMYREFLKRLYRKICRQRSLSKVRAEVSCKNSPRMSPRTSVGSSAGYSRRSCVSESSIYDAVLHCKRTIEK